MAAGLCDAGVPLPAGVLRHPLGRRQEEECKPSKTAGKEIKRKQFYSFFTVSLYTDPHTKNLMFLILKTLSYIIKCVRSMDNIQVTVSGSQLKRFSYLTKIELLNFLQYIKPFTLLSFFSNFQKEFLSRFEIFLLCRRV